jgi:8-oxo-dGTP pyrophosphatase MutT (NUDIX family)
MRRHVTVSGFVVAGGRTALHWHRKNSMWLPPGGHIEPDEDPVQAVVREALEETGVACVVVPHEPPLAFDVPAQVPPPLAILLEDIPDGPHQHIDLVYALRATGADAVERAAARGFVWLDDAALRRGDPVALAACGVDVPLADDVRLLALRAIAVVAAAPP